MVRRRVETSNAAPFIAARDFLLRHREDYATAYREFQMAQARSLQLGARLFRRHGARQCASGAVAGRRRRRRDQALVRGIERALEPDRQCAARSRRAPRRPHPADARQCRAAVGMHAGGDEARRGDRAGDHAAHAQRSCRPLRARPRASCHRQRRCGGEIRRSARRLHAHRRRQGDAGLDLVRGRLRARPPSLRPTAKRGRTIRCCFISPPAPRRRRSSCCTAIRAIRSAICRRCIGSGCGRAICISTFRRPAGPSMPGAVSFRHGTRKPPSSSSTSAASMRAACSTPSRAAA